MVSTLVLEPIEEAATPLGAAAMWVVQSTTFPCVAGAHAEPSPLAAGSPEALSRASTLPGPAGHVTRASCSVLLAACSLAACCLLLAACRLLLAATHRASCRLQMFDAEASSFFYRRCQELKVPMTVVTRVAAYACKLPRSL